jgi:hypothetical protein
MLEFLRCFLLQQEFLQLKLQASATSSINRDSSCNSISFSLAAAAKRFAFILFCFEAALTSACAC